MSALMSSPRRIRVLFCIQNFAGGGAEGVTLSLARSLDPDRFAPVIFAHERLPRFEPPSSTPELPIIIHNTGSYKRTQLPGLLVRTFQLARESDVIVGANEGRPTILGLAVARALAKPCVVWTHYNMREFLRTRSWRQMLALRMCVFSNAIVSCGREVLESAIEVTGMPRSRALAIRNGIPVSSIRQRAEEAVDPADQAYFQGQTILNVGHLSEDKDHATLLAAHALLRAQGGGQSLLLVGKGHLEDAIRAQAKALDIVDSVHLLGYRSNPFPYMRRCTVMGHSSRHEGFGLVLAEALACSAAVVATDCPSGPREILDDGRAGILVPVGDPEALAQGLARVLFNPGERERLVAAGRARAEVFDASHWAAQWGDLLQRLVIGDPV